MSLLAFPRITDAAADVERAIAEGAPMSSLRLRIEHLATLCRRAHAAREIDQPRPREAP